MNYLIDKIDNIIKMIKKEEPKPWYNLYGNNIAPSLDYPEGSIYEAFYDASKKYSLYRGP